MLVEARSDIGYLRQRNEDALLVLHTAGSDSAVVAVADGMGGHPAGDVASRLVVRTLEERIPTAEMPRTDPETTMTSALLAAHQAVLAEAAATPAYRGMGSTAVLALVDGAEVWVAHVGDSRAYLINAGGAALPLTRDHGDGGYLSQALGFGDPVPDVAHIELGPEERLLLCTDGLSGLVHDDGIGALAAGSAVPDAADRLVAAALTAGGYDNVSVILVDPTG